MGNPLFSVIMPTYNRQNELVTCLESLTCQLYLHSIRVNNCEWWKWNAVRKNYSSFWRQFRCNSIYHKPIQGLLMHKLVYKIGKTSEKEHLMLDFLDFRMLDARDLTTNSDDLLDLIAAQGLVQHLQSNHSGTAKDNCVHSLLASHGIWLRSSGITIRYNVRNSDDRLRRVGWNARLCENSPDVFKIL